MASNLKFWRQGALFSAKAGLISTARKELLVDAFRGHRLKYAFPAAVVVLWLAALVPGVRYLRAFENTPGKMAIAPGNWPSQMPPMGDPRLPTLVVALHPRCSCSKATLAELEEAAGEFSHPYNAVMLIFRPRGETYEREQTSLYRDAQKTLHASVVIDYDGELAAKFGAFTSGEVLFYSAPDSDAKRHLLFSGGVTGSRGMVGENAGVESLKVAANGGASFLAKGPMSRPKVFGCGFSALSSPAGKQTTP